MKQKYALTIEQMQAFFDAGDPAKDADFSWVEGQLKFWDEACRFSTEMKTVPAYSLQNILNKLPIRIVSYGASYDLNIRQRNTGYEVCYENSRGCGVIKTTGWHLIDAAFDALKETWKFHKYDD